MKKSLSLGVLFLFILSVLSPIGLGLNVKNIPYQPMSDNRGNILYVGGSGPDNYTKIQDAIDNASSGNTVFVYDDSSPYYNNLVIEKSINLVGEDRNTTIIDGKDIGIIINIKSDHVKISGFKLINCGGSRDGDWEDNVINIVRYGNIVIEDNIISAGNFRYHRTAGIYLVGSSNNVIINNIICDEDIESFFYGIALDYGSNFKNANEYQRDAIREVSLSDNLEDYVSLLEKASEEYSKIIV